MKHLTTYLTLALACLMIACQNDNTVDFSYSPTNPRAGETVSFSNLTAEGEEWAWTFGDGGESTVKSPSKIYRESGTYTVTLKVDDKNYRTCTKTITILDTVPSISCSTNTLAYYQTATLTADFYNPYGDEVTYHWTLPESAVVTQGDSASASISAYFTEIDTDITVSLLLTIDTIEHNLTATYSITDSPERAIVYATTDGQLLRQRMYTNGLAEPTVLNVDAEQLEQTKILLLNENDLYIAAKGIYNFNLQTAATETLNKDANALAAYIASSYLFWADANNIHDIHLTTKNDNVFATISQLTGFPHSAISAIAQYTSLYLVAGDKGIYRFRESDINSGQAPATAPILSDYAITHLAVDDIARKLYFITDNSLYVSNVDGSYPVRIAPQATTLTLDNISNRVYFATTEGIAYLPLVQTQNNTTTADVQILNEANNVVAIAVDNTHR